MSDQAAGSSEVFFVPSDYCSTFTEVAGDLAEQVEVAQDGFVLLDGEYRFCYLNQKAEQLLRKARSELLARNIWQEYPGYIGTELERQMHRAMKERIRLLFDNYYPPAETWFEFKITPLSHAGISMWFRDITNKRRLQEKAERSAATLTALMENVPEGLTVCNASTGKIELVSKYSLDLLRRAVEDLVGSPIESYGEKWHVLRGDGSAPEPRELPVVRALQGETIYCEEWLIEKADGARICVLYNAAPIRDRNGKTIGSVVVWRDITERKAEAERKEESRKIAMAATLAGGVAHELNNFLTSIIGNISLAQDEPGVTGKARSLLEKSLDAAQQSAELLRKLLAFGGKSVFNTREELDVGGMVRNLAGILQAMVPEQTRLELILAEDVPHVRGDPDQIRGALMALLTNAIEATAGQAGTIAVRTRVRELTRRGLAWLRNGSKLKPGTYVSIEVSDTGSGIAPEHLDRIFDPFFSTKFLGRGLGLAAVDGVARGHDGAIGVTTAVGRGSEFRLYLPAVRSET